MNFLSNVDMEVIAGALIFLSILIILTSFLIRDNEIKKWNGALIRGSGFIGGKGYIPDRKKTAFSFITEGTSPEEVKSMLMRAGYENMQPESMYVFALVFSGLFSIFAYSIFYTQYNMIMTILAVSISAIFGYRVLFILLKLKAEDRQREKQAGVLIYAEALEVACEAGLSLMLAIEKISQHYPSSLSSEFRQAYDEFMQSIKTKREALQGIAERVGGEEIKILIDSIIQAEDTGTGIRNILQSVSESIRNNSKKNIIDKGEKAKWKNFMISWVFQFIPYVYIIVGPAVVGLANSLK